MNMRNESGFVFTGWHMIGVVCLFFGTIISVNFYMAYQAVHSWSGLVVENTYVASQQFNSKVAEAKALSASGLTDTLEVTASHIQVTILDAAGQPVVADEVTAILKRPVGDHQDFSVELPYQGQGVYRLERPVLDGHWIVDVSAVTAGKRILHHTQRLAVIGERK
ncbi:FixH family protein [Rhizobium helianthi]|uniref:FixH family protein n=1 Tax=Rhizobium helianthi TaxID=1132695 RepID=A0ABW4M801_9HYPH